MNASWGCSGCGWQGSEPSITDASSEREVRPGVVVADRTHLAVCPQCFEVVSRVDARREEASCS
jgi:hypothetical protein